MKKTAYSILLFASAIVFLASCSTQMSTVSITKRHFNNGYYVNVNHKHSVEHAITSEEPAQGISKAIYGEVAKHNLNIEPIAATQVPTSKHQKKDIELTASALKHSAPGNLVDHLTPNSIQELEHIQSVNKYLSAESNSHNNNNNSLIWTIIIILLVLWLLAYLTGGWGLGGLIWLFLVIALVILLLKLLGVI